MFRGMMSQYMERFYGSLPTAPREGREYRRLGTMEIVRYNLSYTNIELGEAKLLGCRNKGANKWWDPVENELDEIGDSVSEVLGPLAPYIGPNKGSRLIEFDTVTLEMEVEPRGAESSREQLRSARSPEITPDHPRSQVKSFGLSMQSHVTEFGFGVGGGTATATGSGKVWLDNLSIRLADVLAGVGAGGPPGGGGPLGCGADFEVDLHFDGTFEGLGFERLFGSGGPLAPDVTGMLCDGRESGGSLLDSGWQWRGPGPAPVGIRQQTMTYLQERCDPSDPLTKLFERCMFVTEWLPAGARGAAAEMRVALHKARG